MVSKVTTTMVRIGVSPYAWKVREQDLITLDDTECVRLCATNSSLMNFLIGDPSAITALKDKSRHLATSLPGYRAMQSLRNDMQAQSLTSTVSSAASEGFCSLFGSGPEPVRSPDKTTPKRKRARDRTSNRIKLEGASEMMNLELAYDDKTASVKVARPANPRDILIIDFHEDAVNDVVMFIRSHGFDIANAYKPREETMPKGIWRRHRDGEAFFVVKSQKGALKCCKEIGDAIATQAAGPDDESDTAEAPCADDIDGVVTVQVAEGDEVVHDQATDGAEDVHGQASEGGA